MVRRHPRLIGRPTRWAAARVVVFGLVGPWMVPMPWQHADPPDPPVHVSRLGPASTPAWAANLDLD